VNDPLTNSFRIQIKSLYGTEFQNFITKLYLYRYGSEDYIPPRDIKDKGADGIIVGKNMIVACYGPKKVVKSRYIEKIKDDFESYTDNWENNYKHWMFVTNVDLPEYAIRKINELKSDAKQIGVKNILEFIDDLSNNQKRELGKYLKIEQSFFALDYLREVIEDLLKDSKFTDENIKYEKQLYFPDKVKLNYDLDDIDSITDEYEGYIESGVFDEIQSLLYAYEDEDFERLKTRIKNDFSGKSGVFKERLRQLAEHYLIKYSSENDDSYLYYLRAVLVYFFEQCIIGKKTNEEK